MNNLGESKDGSEEKAKIGVSRIMKKDVFLFLLDLEVKRAQRYQNFLSLLLLKFNQCSGDGGGKDLKTCYQALTDLLVSETRETDILGAFRENELIILLPYADASAGGFARTRFENTLNNYDFKSKGYEVMIQQISFPMNGTSTADLFKKALEVEPS